MFANLQGISIEIWVLAIAFIFLVPLPIMWLRRRFWLGQITLTPPFITFTRRPQQPTPNAPAPVSDPDHDAAPTSVDISGNSLLGCNLISVLRDKVRITGNKLIGRNEIRVDMKSSRKKRDSK